MSETVLIVPDTHRPFHDVKAWSLFMRCARMLQPKHLVIIGDFADCYAVSEHAKSPDMVDIFAEEIDDVRNGLDQLDALGAKHKYYIEGNHEDRIARYVAKHPELKGVLTTEKLFQLRERGWAFTPYKQHTNIGKVYFTHDVGVASRNAIFRSLDLYQHSIVTGHCFDDTTEILTRDGWRSHHALSEGVEVATWNREREVVEWQAVEAVHRYAHDGPMIRVTSQNVDLLVTPKHGLWLGDARRASWQEYEARDAVGRQACFRSAGALEAPEAPLTDAQLRVLAWIITDGSYTDDRLIRIAQSDAPNGRLARLESDLQEAGVRYVKRLRYRAGMTEHGTHRNFDAYRLDVQDCASYAWIHASLEPRTKTPSGALLHLNGRQADVMVQAWLMGDGSKNVDSARSWQSSSRTRAHMDYLQALCALSGRRSTLSEYVAPRDTRPMYRMTINTRDLSCVKESAWSVEHHVGPVWCVTVPNHTLLVRRGGKTVVTMNTHRFMTVVEGTALGNEPKVAASFGWLGDVERIDYMHRAKARAGWALGFGFGTYQPKTGFMYLTPVPILPDYSCCIHGQVIR